VPAPLLKQNNSSEMQALLTAVAEELKLPLLHISRSAELAEITNNPSREVLQQVQQTASSALELIDSYMLGLHLAGSQQILQLEPVSASSVIYDVAHRLHKVAERYEVGLEMQLKGAHEPVMANQEGLKAALLSMGTAFIEAQPHGDKRQTITLAAYRTSGGFVAGMYSEACNISPAQLRAAIGFYGKVRQPLGQFSSTGAAGIFVAQQILKAMAAQLKTARHHKEAGIAAILQPSRQLQLI
jgi:hypothetical protein